jgi:glycosyltransferase involved in cell wall biosynthesis
MLKPTFRSEVAWSPPETRSSSEPLSPGSMADQLLSFVCSQLTLAVDTYMPGFRLPRSHAGHLVGSSARADLAYTLALLAKAGIASLAGISVPEALLSVFQSLDGRSTHTFSSYRTAEAIAQYGPAHRNTLLRELSRAKRDNLLQACELDRSAAMLHKGVLSNNFVPVVARCGLARQHLGLPYDVHQLKDVLTQTRSLFASSRGCIDDSVSRCGRYDIYSADSFLFAWPFGHLLSPHWQLGARAMLRLFRRLACRNGSALGWGRSLGVLGICHTIELAALALSRPTRDDAGTWLTLAANAHAHLGDWFADGLTNSHHSCGTDSYRGPERCIQLTFDALGKLATAALYLRTASPCHPATERRAFPDMDDLIWFDRRRGAGVWVYRDSKLEFSLPLTGATTSDYVATPRMPGVLETPVGGPQFSGIPVAFANSRKYVSAGLPHSSSKIPRGLRIRYDSWPLAGVLELSEDSPRLEATRSVEFRVVKGSVRVSEFLRFSQRPEALTLNVAEVRNRPLRMVVAPPSVGRQLTCSTEGLSDWRSFWGALPRVHQVDLKPAKSVRLQWTVAPMVRVVTAHNAAKHPYHRGIYDHLQQDVQSRPLPRDFPQDADSLRRVLSQFDLFHLHWPEWFLGLDTAANITFAEALRDGGLPILWTLHNLQPHDSASDAEAVYQTWAGRADAVIHHSNWGKRQALRTYSFRGDCVHRVIPHFHFGHLIRSDASGRSAVERKLGLSSGKLRLAIIGAPRPSRRVDIVVDAVLSCRRKDIELLVLCAEKGTLQSRDKRIRMVPYSFVRREEYDERLRAVDVVVMPFERRGMLTTGTIGDVVAHGLPALVSNWPYLRETLGRAGICYGSSAADLRVCLDNLTQSQLLAARAATSALRKRYDPRRIAARTLGLVKLLLSRRRSVLGRTWR